MDISLQVQNDHLFISHFHDPSDGFPHLEDGNDWLSDGQMSSSSVVHKLKKHPKVNPEVHPSIPSELTISPPNHHIQTLQDFRLASESITTNTEVTRYQQDIIMFLRLNRGLAGGITSQANRHFEKFARYFPPPPLCPLSPFQSELAQLINLKLN